MKYDFTKKNRGFSIIEILAIVFIISILIAIFLPALQKVMPVVDRAICMNNLKNLRAGFGVYSIEGWPQIPLGMKLGSKDEQQWWLEKTEKDLGFGIKAWQCPTIRRQFSRLSDEERPLIHYLPTPFSGEPDRANKWPEMPWFIEIGNAHGQGNLLVRQNGTVEPSSN